MDNPIKFKIDEKRGLQSRKRKRAFLRLKYIMAAAKARRMYKPRFRAAPPVKLSPKLVNISATDIKYEEVEPEEIKINPVKKLCKKTIAMFATKK